MSSVAARCLLKDVSIVIRDEATASVDADNESYIQQAVTELCRGKILLAIAHRLGITVMRIRFFPFQMAGLLNRIPHDTLMQQSGTYRDFITDRENSSDWSHRERFVPAQS